MHKDLVQLLNCPSRGCESPNLRLEAGRTEEIAYRTGPVEEVREGALVCEGCGRRYPIEGFVPSFEQLFPEDLLEEARYWGDWYGFFWERGYRGFFDLRLPVAHFIGRGIEVPDPGSLSGGDLPGTHFALAQHPLVVNANRVLDVGCGVGWSSLMLARLGHEVIAFDPSAASVRRAKEYAISQGERVEYLATGLGFLSFKPQVFDAVFALHSIHHVPDLSNEMVILKGWMRDGAPLAVDEHIRNDRLLITAVEQLDAWFREKIAPRYTTLGTEQLARAPQEASRMEGAGSEDVLAAIADNFAVEMFEARYVSLDLFSYMYYLWRDCDREAYLRAGQVVAQICGFLLEAFPERAEYVTVLARKAHGPRPTMDALQRVRQADIPPLLSEQLTEVAKSLQGSVEWLNGVVKAKNDHILYLEDLVRRQQAELERLQPSPPPPGVAVLLSRRLRRMRPLHRVRRLLRR